MADIFLSYSEEDREAARRISELLESSGWSVWWDRRIPAGENWRSILDRALETMRCMVVLWSGHSVQSEWVCEEASEGRRLNKLVPIFIEQVRPPAGFREIQAANLVGWDGSRSSPAVQELIRDLADRLGKPLTGVEAAVESLQIGKESRDATATAEEKREGFIPEASGDVGNRRPRHGEYLRRFAPWLIAGALALAAAAVLVPLGKQAHRDPGTVTSADSPPTATYAAPAKDKPAEKVPTTPDTSAMVLPPPKTPEPSAPPTVATPTPTPAAAYSPPTKDIVPARAAPKSIQPAPSVPSDIKAGDVKASHKAKTEVSAARSVENPNCSAILQELQLGGVLSDKKQAFFEKECKR